MCSLLSHPWAIQLWLIGPELFSTPMGERPSKYIIYSSRIICTIISFLLHRYGYVTYLGVLVIPVFHQINDVAQPFSLMCLLRNDLVDLMGLMKALWCNFCVHPVPSLMFCVISYVRLPSLPLCFRGCPASAVSGLPCHSLSQPNLLYLPFSLGVLWWRPHYNKLQRAASGSPRRFKEI